MPRIKLKDLWQKIRSRTSGLKGFNFKILLIPLRHLMSFITSWWRALIIALAALIFLYYPLGGLLIDNLDNSTSYEIKTRPEQSATAEMMALLINREVNQKLWTPALPFFFPSAWLDNMPAYQLGMISSVAGMAESLAQTQEKAITGPEDPLVLKKAAELLQYPGTIWMFSPQNPLLPAPSASSQYGKARKLLIRYNKFLAAGLDVYYKSPEDLALILKKISFDLGKNGIFPLERQIREENTSWIDLRADDVFYHSQGKAYAYFLLLKALGYDYKEIILSRDLYPLWTRMLGALETASGIRPLIIRNGSLTGILAPNHLNYLAFYMLKAQKDILTAAEKLSARPRPAKEQP